MVSPAKGYVRVRTYEGCVVLSAGSPGHQRALFLTIGLSLLTSTCKAACDSVSLQGLCMRSELIPSSNLSDKLFPPSYERAHFRVFLENKVP